MGNPLPWTVKEIWIRDQGTDTVEGKTYLQVLHERAAPESKEHRRATRIEAVDTAARLNREWTGKRGLHFAVVLSPNINTTTPRPGFLIDLEKATGNLSKSLWERYNRRGGPSEPPVIVFTEVRMVEHRWLDPNGKPTGETRLRHSFRWKPGYADTLQERVLDPLFFADGDAAEDLQIESCDGYSFEDLEGFSVFDPNEKL
jgi:hypothetical protein